jgi:hypothetical protein
MPMKLRLTVRKRAKYSETRKAKNYRAGMPSPLFARFVRRGDLDARLRDFLSKFQVTDAGSLKFKSYVETLLAKLPNKIPPRVGRAPIPGQRDHYYVRFFLIMHTYLDSILSSDPNDRKFYEFRDADIPIFYRGGYSMNHGVIGDLVYLRGVLHYFDDGEGHGHAKAPVLSKKTKLHLKKMLAKREQGLA